MVGSWLSRRLLTGGAYVVALVRDVDPQSELVRSGDHRRVTAVVNGDARGPRRRRARRRRARGRHGLPPRRPDDRRRRPAEPARDVRGELQGTWNVLEACRRIAARAAGRRRVSDKAYGDGREAALHRGHAAARAGTLRRLEELHRPARDRLRASVRPAGRDRALRQHLRRRRPELEPHRARHDPLRCSAASGRCIRSDGTFRARLPLRRGRASPPTCALGSGADGRTAQRRGVQLLAMVGRCPCWRSSTRSARPSGAGT